MTDETKYGSRAYLAGLALVFAAAVLWSLNGALIKLTYQDGLGPHGVTIAFYRSLFAGLFLLPLARGKLHTLSRNVERRIQNSESRIPKREEKRSSLTAIPHSPFAIRYSLFAIRHFLFNLRPAALSCIVFFTLMTVCFVLATTKTEAANAIILQYTSTFWIFSLSPLVLGEKPRRSDLWLLGLAMAGIAIIFAGKASTDLVGLLIALSAGLFYGLETLMIRRMRDSDSAAVIVVNNLGAVVLLMPAAFVVGHLMVTTRAWILLILLGVVQFGLPYYLYARALVRVPAHQAALITLAEPVLVPLWTYFAVREKVPVTTVIGGGVILIALALFVRAARKSRLRSVATVNPDSVERTA